MIYPELFNDLKKEFPENIALGVCVAVGIIFLRNPRKKTLKLREALRRDWKRKSEKLFGKILKKI